MRSVRFAVGTLATAVLLCTGLSAFAGPPGAGLAAAPIMAGDTGNAAEAAPAATLQDASAQAGAPSGSLSRFGSPVASDRLKDMRGGAEVVVNDMQLNGVVANNSASRVVTGSNAITDGAFSSASGLPTVIQNTGANVLIQNATILNVQFKP
jgi:hypothetical protein